VARVRVYEGASGVWERAAQLAYRDVVTLSGRLDSCNPISHVGAWNDLCSAADSFARVVRAAREEALERARVVSAARRAQLQLLPRGSVVAAAERGPERVCAHCDQVFFGDRCLSCYRMVSV
jgi:hypothetical protein